MIALNRKMMIFGVLIVAFVIASTSLIAQGSESDGNIGDSFTDGSLNYEIILDTPATVRVTGLNDQTITDLDIPSTVSYNSKTYMVVEIAREAFKKCTGLTSVIISENITSIGVMAFDGCRNVSTLYFNPVSCSASGEPFSGLGTTSGLSVKIGQNVTKIPSNLFSGSKAISNIVFGSSVMSIGDRAFYNCSNLTVADFSGATDLKSIGTSAFSGCSSLKDVELSKSPITSIGDYAFYRCYSFTSVSLGSSITYLGTDCFDECIKVSSISYDVPKLNDPKGSIFSDVGRSADSTNVVFGPNVLEIPRSIFHNGMSDNNIRSVTFSEGIKTIGEYAFYRCVKITSISLPDSIVTIGERAFSNCTGLTEITIPENVERIEINAFSNCYKVHTIHYNAKNAQSSYPFISDSVAKRTLIFGDSVEKIPAGAFDSYRNWVVTCSISASVKEIASKAFDGCYGITTMTILGAPKLGDGCLSLSYRIGLSAQNANCTIYSMFDEEYLNRYADSNTNLNAIVLPHVELDLDGVELTTVLNNPFLPCEMDPYRQLIFRRSALARFRQPLYDKNIYISLKSHNIYFLLYYLYIELL